MKDFLTDEEMNAMDSDAPDFIPDEEVKEEGPGLGRRLYEQNVVIPVRAARKFVPYADTIQHKVIDPAIGAFTGETPEERQRKREEYDDYLRRQYPLLLDAYEVGADLTSSLYKPAAVQATEPIVNQTMTHPERLGFNLETGLNSLPVATGAALSAPKRLAQGVGFIKTKQFARPSMKKYEENPYYYDIAEAEAGGEPKKAMVRGMIDELELKQNDKTMRLQAEEEAMAKARAERSDAQREISMAKRDIEFQRRNYLEDERQRLKIDADDGTTAQTVVGELKTVNSNAANLRNKILESQGTVHDVYEISEMFDVAIRNVTDPSEVAALRTAQNRLWEIAREGGDETAIVSRRLNDFRKYLQDQIVNWGKWMTPKERGFNSIARSINDELDSKIVGNDELRAKLRQHTIDYNDAMDLFGDDYNINKLRTAMVDPQRRAVVERIMANNPELTNMASIAKKVDQQGIMEESIRRGWKPNVPAEKDFELAKSDKSAAIRAYLEARQARKGIAAEKFPLTPDNVESKLHQSMMKTDMRPKERLDDQITRYAKEVHPGGPDQFWKTYDQNKVLYDLSTMDTTNGSRMVNLGKALFTPLGAAVGYMMGDKSGIAATIGGGMGAGVGAYLDNNASKFYRAGIKAPLMAPGLGRSITAGMGVSSETLNSKQTSIPFEKLAGTPYESMFIQAMQQGGNKPATLHYMLSKRDPNYFALVKDTLEDPEKEPLATPKYKGLGADLGGIIDSFTGSDNIGLDPQEKPPEGFEYGEGVPQPASIKPFSFKKLFPKFSAEGSQIKQLPTLVDKGFSLKGLTFKEYRDLNVGGNLRRFYKGELHPSEKIAAKKFDAQYTPEHPERNNFLYKSEGAVLPSNDGGINFGMARVYNAVPHEHIHAQLANVKKIHPLATGSLEKYYRDKLRSYGFNPNAIVNKMHGPAEFLTSIRDILDTQIIREKFNLNTASAAAMRGNPYHIEDNRKALQKLRKFYNDTAYEAENMTKEDLLNIIEKYNKSPSN